MAFAEARAAWQRAANRCLVQEDAKRAPKLACCSSGPPSAKQSDTGPAAASGGQDIPCTNSIPLNRNISNANSSPNSKWWLQLQPNYVYQKGLMDEKFNSQEDNLETGQVHETNYDPGHTDQTENIKSSFGNQYSDLATGGKKDARVMEEELRTFCTQNCLDPFKGEVKEDIGEIGGGNLVGCEDSKISHELYFDSESSWISSEKGTPWWRTADQEELAFLVTRRSLESIENCDLPRPHQTGMGCFSHDGSSYSSLGQKPCTKIHHRFSTHFRTPDSLTAGSGYQDRRLRGSQRTPTFENEASKAQLLEALCHSQTRAREAERAAKQASAEKEDVIKLLFRQASQLFAYRQWLQLLQMKNMYLQLRNNRDQMVSIVYPMLLPRTTRRRARKVRRSWQRPYSRKRPKPYQVGRRSYSVVLALGLGLVGAGLLLGWTVGWMLPIW